MNITEFYYNYGHVKIHRSYYSGAVVRRSCLFKTLPNITSFETVIVNKSLASILLNWEPSTLKSIAYQATRIKFLRFYSRNSHKKPLGSNKYCRSLCQKSGSMRFKANKISFYLTLGIKSDQKRENGKWVFQKM